MYRRAVLGLRGSSMVVALCCVGCGGFVGLDSPGSGAGEGTTSAGTSGEASSTAVPGGSGGEGTAAPGTTTTGTSDPSGADSSPSTTGSSQSTGDASTTGREGETTRGSSSEAGSSETTGNPPLTCDDLVMEDTVVAECSPFTGNAVTLTIDNNCRSRAVELFWINGGCGEASYATLQPGAEFDQPTFEGHNWRVRDADTGELLVDIAPLEANRTVTLP